MKKIITPSRFKGIDDSCVDPLQVKSELENKVIVEGINMVKKHVKPRGGNETGGIVDVEAKIDASNVMLIDPKTNKVTRKVVKTVKKEKKSEEKKETKVRKSNKKEA